MRIQEMENTLRNLKTKLWQKGNISRESGELNSDYWNNISFSLTAVNHSINEFSKNNNPEISVCFAKILIMELWSIREFLKALNSTTSEFDVSFPKIKELRDSYAHIDERIKGEKKQFKSPPKRLSWEQQTIANGTIISNDGINWQITKPLKRQFNMNFNGNYGVMSIFGIVNDYLICNSDNNLLELEINEQIINKLIIIIEKACA